MKSLMTLICRKHPPRRTEFQLITCIQTKIDYDTFSSFKKKKSLIKPAESAKLADVNPETARKRKREYEKDPEKKVPLKKTNCASN